MTGTNGSKAGVTCRTRRWRASSGVAGYYVRIATLGQGRGAEQLGCCLRNREGETIKRSAW